MIYNRAITKKKGDIAMPDIERFWKDAPADCVVCASTDATKNMVLRAIVNGARDIESLKKTVSLCGTDECAALNPAECGCVESAKALLSIYVPVYEIMTADGGCKQHGKNRP